MKFCPKCKAENQNDANYCEGCGCLLTVENPVIGNLLKYSISGYYLKLITSMLCFILVIISSILFVMDVILGYALQGVINNSKDSYDFTWLITFMVIPVTLIIGIALLKSAFREKKHLQPYTGCFAMGFWILSVFYSLFAILFIIIMEAFTYDYYNSDLGEKSFFFFIKIWLPAIFIFMIVAPTSLREIFIGKIYKNK
jgi:hypothetical protein